MAKTIIRNEIIKVKIYPNGNVILSKNSKKVIKEWKKNGFDVIVEYSLYANSKPTIHSGYIFKE